MQLAADLSFPDWVGHVFDHPVTDPAWYWADDAPFWDLRRNSSLMVAYLTRLFREPDAHLARFAPAQINQGLWYVVSPSCSDYAFCVFDAAVPLVERVECVGSVFDLYARCFARLCSNHYGHLDRGPEPPSPVNSICYMFWDLFPVSPRSRRASDPAHNEWLAQQRAALLAKLEEGLKRALTTKEQEDSFRELKPLSPEERREHAALEEACLGAMERTLELGHPACQEGALHGLAHFQSGYPERVQAAVDAFLRLPPGAGPALVPELRAYALSARSGCVL